MKIPRKVGKRDEKEMVSSFTCRNDDNDIRCMWKQFRKQFFRQLQ